MISSLRQWIQTLILTLISDGYFTKHVFLLHMHEVNQYRNVIVILSKVRLVQVYNREASIVLIFITASHQTGFDTRSFYSGVFGGRRSGTSLCWTLLVKGLTCCNVSQMTSLDLDSLRAMWVQHICLLIAWNQTRGSSAMPTRRWLGRSQRPFGLKSITDLEFPIRHECQTAQWSIELTKLITNN